jgi:hypothetical protein
MARDRDMSIHAALKALAIDGLNKYLQEKSRSSPENIPGPDFLVTGHGLQRDREKAQRDSLLPPSLSATRFREADVAKRREEAGQAAGRDSPADLR